MGRFRLMPKRNSTPKSSISANQKMKKISKEAQDSLKRIFEASFSDSIESIHHLSEKLPSELRNELERSVRRVSSKEKLDELNIKLNDVENNLEQNIQDKDTAEKQVRRIEEKVKRHSKELKSIVSKLDEVSLKLNSTILESSSKDLIQQTSNDLCGLKKSLKDQKTLLKSVVLDKETADKFSKRLEKQISNLETKFNNLFDIQKIIKETTNSKAKTEAEFRRESKELQQRTTSSLKDVAESIAKTSEISIHQRADITLLQEEIRKLKIFSIVVFSIQALILLFLLIVFLHDKV